MRHLIPVKYDVLKTRSKITREIQKNREIWKDQKLSLSEIIVRMGKVFGDICRWERNAPKDSSAHTDDELKKNWAI